MISEILLADRFSMAPYGKINLIGCNPSPMLAVDIPYQLQTNVVALIAGPFNLLTLDAYIHYPSGSESQRRLMETTSNAVVPAGQRFFGVVACRLIADFEGECELDIHASTDGETTIRRWNVRQGIAPLGGTGHQSQQIVDASGSDAFDIATLFASCKQKRRNLRYVP
jgi:hypothetical protein